MSLFLQFQGSKMKFCADSILFHFISLDMFEICMPEINSLSIQSNDIFQKANKPPETFSSAISFFIQDAECVIGSAFHIREIAKRYCIQRRRLYDVLLVLEVCGVCKKTSVDTIIWKGMQNIFKNVQALIGQKNLTPLSPRSSITIAELTETLLVSFFKLKKSTVNIRELASMLATNANRQKTLLCKLHQIAFILDAAGIIKKTNYCYVTLTPRLSALNNSCSIDHSTVPSIETPSFLSIESLLNKH